MSKAQTPFDSLRNDREVREGAESLGERDDTLGAAARIAMALADGDNPDPDDCEEAGLETLAKLVEEHR